MKELVDLPGLPGIIHLLRILEILTNTSQYNYISSKIYNGVADPYENDRLNKVYEYIFKHFRKKVSIAVLSDLLHMTPTSFSRYFTIKNNKSFSRFISEIRIKHACKMLLETQASIEQICYDSGFNTLSNFNKQFKEITNKRPREYRKEFGTF